MMTGALIPKVASYTGIYKEHPQFSNSAVIARKVEMTKQVCLCFHPPLIQAALGRSFRRLCRPPGKILHFSGRFWRLALTLTTSIPSWEVKRLLKHVFHKQHRYNTKVSRTDLMNHSIIFSLCFIYAALSRVSVYVCHVALFLMKLIKHHEKDMRQGWKELPRLITGLPSWLDWKTSRYKR